MLPSHSLGFSRVLSSLVKKVTYLPFMVTNENLRQLLILNSYSYLKLEQCFSPFTLSFRCAVSRTLNDSSKTCAAEYLNSY